MQHETRRTAEQARRLDLVLQVMQGDGVARLATRSGVSIRRLDQWHRRAIAAVIASLEPRRRKSGEGRELAHLRRTIDELRMENELFRKVAARSRSRVRSAEIRMLSRLVSPSTGHRYGLARVCRVLGVRRATFYRKEALQDVAEYGFTPPPRGRPVAVEERALEDLVAEQVKERRQQQRPVTIRGVWSAIRNTLQLPIALRRVRTILDRIAPAKWKPGRPPEHQTPVRRTIKRGSPARRHVPQPPRRRRTSKTVPRRTKKAAVGRPAHKDGGTRERK